jgi:hypothetical protein
VTKRWSETQHLVAGWFAARGWPLARAVGTGRGGVDVDNMPGLGCEVKSSRDKEWRPTLWLRQARRHGGVAFVVYRPTGFGPERMGKWPVVVDLSTFTALLRAAGYGDDDDAP